MNLFEQIASVAAVMKVKKAEPSLMLRLEADAVNRSVHSSTWIEGNRLSLQQVEALSLHRIVAAEENQKKEVENCLKALRWAIRHQGKSLTEANLLRLHAMMMKGLLPSERCGTYRKIQNYIINARRQIIFTPPPPAQVKKNMSAVFGWIKRSTEHPVVRAAVFHHAFAAIHPFTDGNGRTARTASQWLLWEKGYDPLHTLGLDDFFASDHPRYYEMIKQTHEMDGDYTHWVEYVAEGLLESVRRIDRIKNAAQTKGSARPVLTPKQEELLKFLSKGPMGSMEIGQRMKINRARVNQLVSPMVRAGIVIRHGMTRGAQYHLA